MNNDNFIGDCRNEKIIESIFGSVSEFARQVELNGNEFIYKKSVKVVYNQVADVHGFFFT